MLPLRKRSQQKKVYNADRVHPRILPLQMRGEIT